VPESGTRKDRNVPESGTGRRTMEWLKNKIKNDLIEPLMDSQRVMKLEYLLSHNYILAAFLIFIDVVMVSIFSYVTNLVFHIPVLLVGKADASEVFSLRHLLPKMGGISAGGVLGVLFLLLVFDLVLVFRIKVSWSDENFNVGQRGTDRFTTEKEIREQYTAVEPLETLYPGEPGILVARIGNTFYIDQMVVNNLIIGITRSGKGEMFVRACIEIYSRAQKRASLLINDPKLEHYKTFAPILEEREYEVHLLNASNPLLSMGFNLVGLVIEYYRKRDYDAAEQVANSLAHSFFNVDEATGDMIFFTSSASALFTAMVLAAVQDAFQADEKENENRYHRWNKLGKEEKEAHPFQYRQDNVKTVNIYSMIVTFGQLVTRPVNKSGTKTLLDVYFENRSDNDRARLKYLNTEVAHGKTKSGIFSEMLRNLEAFTLRNVGKMTAESTLKISDIGFGEKPVAVFMATPSYDTYLHKIPTIFIRQMYFALGKICDDHKGKCDRQVKIIFDESGNMPPVDLMDTMTTMGLGQNISIDMYLQSYEQLDELYGKEKAETIRGNCANHFFLQSSSEDTAKKFSSLLGTRSDKDIQRAGGKLSFHKYYTESIRERPLLYPNELMQLQEGEVAIFRRSKRRDNAGNSIKPRPIFNSRENGHYLWYFHKYAPKERYKNPNEVNLLEMCRESRKQINLAECTWNIEKSFRMMGINVRINTDYAEDGATVKTLYESGRYQVIDQMLTKLFGEHYEEIYGITGDTTIAEYIGWIHSQEIDQTEKEILLDGF
jgi:type IV secretion system protein VirD4